MCIRDSNKPANSDIYTTAFAEWVEAFGTHAAPDYLPHLFLSLIHI